MQRRAISVLPTWGTVALHAKRMNVKGAWLAHMVRLERAHLAHTITPRVADQRSCLLWWRACLVVEALTPARILLPPGARGGGVVAGGRGDRHVRVARRVAKLLPRLGRHALDAQPCARAHTYGWARGVSVANMASARRWGTAAAQPLLARDSQPTRSRVLGWGERQLLVYMAHGRSGAPTRPSCSMTGCTQAGIMPRSSPQTSICVARISAGSDFSACARHSASCRRHQSALTLRRQPHCWPGHPLKGRDI